MVKSTTGLAILLAVLCLCVGGITSYALFPNTVEKTVVQNVTVPQIVEVPYNDTAIVADIADIKAILNEDDAWEIAAEDIATEEWSENTYKDIYNAMIALNISIDDKTDIDKVVIKDTSFSGMDVDDKDAEVTQEVKVYYEDLNGDDKKIYLDIVTTIADNDIEDQEITLH